MSVYSYYYGASVDKGIGVQAQSVEIEGMPIRYALKELSSLHALESSDRGENMLSYLLDNGEQDDSKRYGILGLSYIEPPKSSGYSRSAPCGLIYVAGPETMADANLSLGSIVNFVNFQKPDSPSPSKRDHFPLNESGYLYHNSASLLSPLVDALARVALSLSRETLVVGLPKGKNEYATARYTMAEALNYLPMPVRQKIRFFTGLPVPEGVTDPLTGFDNALKYGANVIFCPAEYFQLITSHKNCIPLNMSHPDGHTGVFSSFIARSQDVSGDLAQISYHLNGLLTYENLNKATEQMQQSNAVSPLMMAKKLEETLNSQKNLAAQLQARTQQFDALKKDYDKVMKQNNAWEKQQQEQKMKQKRERIIRWILIGVLIVMCVLLFIEGKEYIKLHDPDLWNSILTSLGIPVGAIPSQTVTILKSIFT